LGYPCGREDRSPPRPASPGGDDSKEAKEAKEARGTEEGKLSWILHVFYLMGLPTRAGTDRFGARAAYGLLIG